MEQDFYQKISNLSRPTELFLWRIKEIKEIFEQSWHAHEREKLTIENEVSPYDEPPKYFNPEDGEPPYLTEWLNTDAAQSIMTWNYLSILSEYLRLFIFDFFKKVLRLKYTDNLRKGYIRPHLVNLNKIIGKDIVSTDDIDFLEAIVLVRNHVTHPSDLSNDVIYKWVKDIPNDTAKNKWNEFTGTTDEENILDVPTIQLSLSQFLKMCDFVENVATKLERVPVQHAFELNQFRKQLSP